MQNSELVDQILREAAEEWRRQGRLSDDWWESSSALGSQLAAESYLRQILTGYLVNALVLGGYLK